MCVCVGWGGGVVNHRVTSVCVGWGGGVNHRVTKQVHALVSG